MTHPAPRWWVFSCCFPLSLAQLEESPVAALSEMFPSCLDVRVQWFVSDSLSFSFCTSVLLDGCFLCCCGACLSAACVRIANLCRHSHNGKLLGVFVGDIPCDDVPARTAVARRLAKVVCTAPWEDLEMFLKELQTLIMQRHDADQKKSGEWISPSCAHRVLSRSSYTRALTWVHACV